MEKKIQEIKRKVLGEVEIDLDMFLEETKSPAEQLFALQILKFLGDGGWHTLLPIEERKFEYNIEDDRIREAQIDFYGNRLLLIPQFKVKKYHTIDFLIYLPKYDIRVAIEVDGHDFHEKTKEQAKRDKQRDRWLVTNGFYVFRFTGSEVYNNKPSIGIEIETLLIKLLQEKGGK